jgi:hypothetical protein
MTENKFELQSYFILYLLFVRILNLSKDIVSFLHISNFFVRERTCFLFRSKKFFRTTQELGYMTKTLNQIFFFLH